MAAKLRDIFGKGKLVYLGIDTIMKNFIFILILLFASIQVSAQKCVCKYYQFDYWEADALNTFTFSGGKSVKVCPAIQYFPDNNKVYFRDFALEDCDGDSVILLGNRYTYYTIEMIKDNLVVKEILNLPTGKKRKNKSMLLSLVTVQLKDDKFVVTKTTNRIRRYTPEEITLTLKEQKDIYKMSGQKLRDWISRLFIAALSDEKANEIFLSLKSQFPDMEGTPLENYQNLQELLQYVQENGLQL